jgi:preprotein translocase subunit SecA
MEHLEAMDYLRSSVNLRAYGQREPIVEYKKEGLRMFKEMEVVFLDQVGSLVATINEAPQAEVPTQTIVLNTNAPQESSAITSADKAEVGRNDLCPCGSGKKYKKCHGK